MNIAPDDQELLKLMIEDTGNAPNIYKPTNYWAVCEKSFLPELEKLGLRDFRRRKNSIQQSFGATDLFRPPPQIDLRKSRMFNNRITRRIPLWSRFLSLQNGLLNRVFPVSCETYEAGESDQLLYEFARLYGEKVGAKPVYQFKASLIGNPEHVIMVGDKPYTISILSCYLQYAYCCNYIDFDGVKILVELGCGSGKQVEVIKKLHPDICFLLFDIPPQVYVCEQYLKSVFPGDVVSYRDTKQMDSVTDIRGGRIFIFGNWKFPIIGQLRADLFWNSASFQEMEPDVVANYLKYINTQARAVYLREVMGGKEVALTRGSPGVLKQTKLEDYRKGLGNFKLHNISPVLWPIRKRSGYSNSFWGRLS